MADDVFFIYLMDDLAVGQHRDHRIDTLHRVPHCGARRATMLLGAGKRVGRKVEGVDLMPRLHKVRGHPAAHIAKTDERDFHVICLSRRRGASR